MVRYIKSRRKYDVADDIFAMSKLTAKNASKDLFSNKIPTFIYFSEVQAGHGPRIKFYGGSKETSDSRKCPSYTFTQDGAGEVILQDWHDKKNCPYGYDDTILSGIEYIINKNLPIFLLVWFRRLDDDDAVLYFTGHATFENTIHKVRGVSSDFLNEYEKVKTDVEKKKEKGESVVFDPITTFHDLCKKHDLYHF